MTQDSGGNTPCSYCKKPCDGVLSDLYGEWQLNRPVPICAECAEDFATEPDPYGWGD